MKNSTASNRKTGRMIAKNLIVLVVLVVVVAIAIWAWFINQNEATASGISIKSTSNGVNVSWDGNTPFPLKPITGNGLEFFEPYLNRRKGEVLLNDDNTSWQGEVINSYNSTGKYVDIDLYFRDNSQKNVYLAGDSQVYPTSEENFSAYGDFSKDYISAATRVAFLNAEKTRCSFIWAPNDDIELIEGDDYSKMSEADIKTETISGVSGATIPDDMLFENDGNSYQFWFPAQYANDKITQTSNMVATPMEFQKIKDVNGKQLGLFTFTFKMDPSMRQDSPTFPFIINEQNDTLTPDDISKYVDSSSITGNNDGNSLIEFSQHGFNIKFNDNSEATAPEFYIKPALVTSTNLNITFGYRPNGKVIVLGYSNENGESYDRVGTGGGGTSVKYYDLPDQSTTVALVNTGSSFVATLDSSNGYKKAISFSNREKTTIYTSAITANEMFTAIKTGSGFSATYTFKSRNNKYLNVADDGTVSFSNTATQFTLAYIDGFRAPVLKSNSGRYIVISNGSLKAVTLGNLKKTEFVTVFIGSGYELIKNSTATQEYEYYDSIESKAVATLNENSNPPLFSSTTNESATTIIGTKTNNEKIPVATLSGSNGVFEAHIVMRIWVEGTDRETKTPLADGKFKASLHFVLE